MGRRNAVNFSLTPISPPHFWILGNGEEKFSTNAISPPHFGFEKWGGETLSISQYSPFLLPILGTGEEKFPTKAQYVLRLRFTFYIRHIFEMEFFEILFGYKKTCCVVIRFQLQFWSRLHLLIKLGLFQGRTVPNI